MEDGTEVPNIPHRNPAASIPSANRCCSRLPPHSTRNDGLASGGLHQPQNGSFTRNVARGMRREYGYFFQPPRRRTLKPGALPSSSPRGKKRSWMSGSLPFVRFDDNEAHCQRRRAAFNSAAVCPSVGPPLMAVPVLTRGTPSLVNPSQPGRPGTSTGAPSCNAVAAGGQMDIFNAIRHLAAGLLTPIAKSR